MPKAGTIAYLMNPNNPNREFERATRAHAPHLRFNISRRRKQYVRSPYERLGPRQEVGYALRIRTLLTRERWRPMKAATACYVLYSVGSLPFDSKISIYDG